MERVDLCDNAETLPYPYYCIRRMDELEIEWRQYYEDYMAPSNALRLQRWRTEY